MYVFITSRSVVIQKEKKIEVEEQKKIIKKRCAHSFLYCTEYTHLAAAAADVVIAICTGG